MFGGNLDVLHELAQKLEETSKAVKEEISQSRAKMDEEKEQWEREKKEMSEKFKVDDNLINLNVGGKYLATYKSVLCKIPDSMLAAMFSGRHPFVKDPEGRYFIDRNGEVCPSRS